MSVSVCAGIHIYEIDGDNSSNATSKDLQIKSVWNNGRLVDILVPGGPSIQVGVDDLIQAISRCSG